MQSKRDSLIESNVNTWVGLIGSLILTALSNYAGACYGWQIWFTTCLSVFLCTVWSLFRGYYVRRFFERRQLRKGVQYPLRNGKNRVTNEGFASAPRRDSSGFLPLGNVRDISDSPRCAKDRPSAE